MYTNVTLRAMTSEATTAFGNSANKRRLVEGHSPSSSLVLRGRKEDTPPIPSSSAAAAVAAAATLKSSILSYPSSSTYQLTSEIWASQSGMGTSAQAEPLGDYGGGGEIGSVEYTGSSGVSKTEENGGKGQILKAVQRAEEWSNSVGESIY